MPEYVSICVDVSQYVWTWLNIGLNMAEYCWMSLNMSGNAWINCSDYASVLNMPEFWIWPDIFIIIYNL